MTRADRHYCPKSSPAPSSPLNRLRLETLESRLLMTVNPDEEYAEGLDHGMTCACPVCAGMALQQVAAEVPSASQVGQTVPLSSIPALNSLPGARATLYLDFDGDFQAQWGQYRNVTTPVFDRDGDATTFSQWEITTITDIWAQTAEDYAPFAINVTTVDPGNASDGLTARIAIGGNWSNWFGSQAGGVAYVGGFFNSAPNVGFVFEDALGNGNAKYVAEAVSHEAGHLFGLQHQSTWSGTRLVSAYNQGNSNWAPIMGVGYYSQRTTWHNGATSSSSTAKQDDMAILGGSRNGFGFRADDYGNGATSAFVLAPNGNSTTTVTGLIGNNTDVDWFRFDAAAGAASFQVDVNSVSANLDCVLELRNQVGTLVQRISPTDRLSASLTTTLSAGRYFLVVRSSGGYGNVGTYTLNASWAAPATSGSGTGSGTGGSNTSGSGTSNTTSTAEIDLFQGQTPLASGAVVDFGAVDQGVASDRTITIKNTGTATLTLTPLSAANLPAGFTLVSNIGNRNLAPGKSTTFRVRMKATAGEYGGTLQIQSNDADESNLAVQLRGTVLPPPLVIDDGAAGFSTTGVWTTLRAGRERDSRWTAQGDGSSQATWQFNGLQPGVYTVHASWQNNRNFATDARYQVGDGTQTLGQTSVNQERPPSGLSWNGTRWASLGTVTITGSQLVVTLNNLANDRVTADAIRIQRIGAAENSSLPSRSGQSVEVLDRAHFAAPDGAASALEVADHQLRSDRHEPAFTGEPSCDREQPETARIIAPIDSTWQGWRFTGVAEDPIAEDQLLDALAEDDVTARCQRLLDLADAWLAEESLDAWV